MAGAKKNIIFVFSGTGNSLWAAKEISKELTNCEVVGMSNKNSCLLIEHYDSIGFVYPTYAGGIPRCVAKFASHLNLWKNKDSYFFAVATCGRICKAQNAVSQLRHILKPKGVKLSYGEKLRMFSNYVVKYEMRDTVREEAAQSAIDLQPIIESIKNRIANTGNTVITPRHIQYIGFRIIVSNMDRNFNVSDDCMKCDICKKVCPVSNIDRKADEKPFFKHQCEHCMSCLQNCPSRAINYKHKTQNRKRYIHLNISWQELAKLNSRD
jgi:Fe-S-cluster-containing hydrogenase component 2